MTEIIEHAGYRITIRQDDFAENPEDMTDSPVYLFHGHRQFHNCSKELPFKDSSGFLALFVEEPDPTGYPPNPEDFEGGETDEDYLGELAEWKADQAAELAAWREAQEEWAVFFVDSYIHSGIVLALAGSLEAARMPDRRWDVSQCGAILIRKDPAFWGEGEVDYRKIAEAHVSEWNMFLCGDIWWYRIEEVTHCDHCGAESTEEVETLSGIYGYDYAVSEAKSTAEHLRKRATPSEPVLQESP